MADVIGNVLNNVGKLVRALFVTCPVPAQMWAKTAVVAFGKVFTSNIAPVWKTDVKMLTGKTWLKHATQRLEEIEAETPAFWNGASESLHFVGEAADKTAFWVWIASMLSDFLYDWGSLMLRMGGCDANKRHCVTTWSNPFGSVDGAHIWWQGPAWREDFPTPGQTGSSTFFVPGGANFSISFAITFNLLDGGPCAGSSRLIELDTGQVVWEASASEQDSLTGKGPVMTTLVESNSELTHRYQIQCRADQDHIGVGMGFASGQLTVARGDCVQLL